MNCKKCKQAMRNDGKQATAWEQVAGKFVPTAWSEVITCDNKQCTMYNCTFTNTNYGKVDVSKYQERE